MASDENMTFESSLQDKDFDDDVVNDGHDHNHHHHQHPHNLCRLSVCSSSTCCSVDGDKNHDDVDNAMTMYVSRLSIENLEGEEEGDADGEFSDGSESKNELSSSYSLLAMPSRRRNLGRLKTQKLIPAKYYASDNEAQKSALMGEKTKKYSWRTRKSRRKRKEKWVFDGANYNWEKNGDENKKTEYNNLNESPGGDSDERGRNIGVRVITRPKGGRRTLCMDLEEVKACRDLGFELEHEVMLEMPCSCRLSVDTASSGGNSPISNWCLCTPSDDPREVKARLKVWAQAVALASASKCDI